jgi:regulator of protease activity HflC (stomatin/prohibitin superfamily)
MLGIEFVKVDPTQYVMQFRKGQVVKEGPGLAFLYFAPTSSVVAVPTAAMEQGFMFEHVTRDFQAVTVQGQVVFRVREPKKTAALLNFTLTADGKRYASDDASQLPARVVRAVEVLSQQAVKGWPLKEALLATDRLATLVATGLAQSAEITSLGLEVLGVSVVAIRPTPETAKALEAEAREAILKSADDAIYARRNAAVEAEREIRESELETQVAIEKKQRTVRETQMDAEAAIQARQQALRQSRMEADIALEKTRASFVATNAANTRVLAEAEAHRVGTAMQALQSADPRVVQALAAVGMQPGQLIAQAFSGIAERAEKIGQLNVSPELLAGLLAGGSTPAGTTVTLPAAEKGRAARP